MDEQTYDDRVRAKRTLHFTATLVPVQNIRPRTPFPSDRSAYSTFQSSNPSVDRFSVSAVSCSAANRSSALDSISTLI